MAGPHGLGMSCLMYLPESIDDSIGKYHKKTLCSIHIHEYKRCHISDVLGILARHVSLGLSWYILCSLLSTTPAWH